MIRTRTRTCTRTHTCTHTHTHTHTHKHTHIMPCHVNSCHETGHAASPERRGGQREKCQLLWHLCRFKSDERRNCRSHVLQTCSNDSRLEWFLRCPRLQLWRLKPADDLKHRLHELQWKAQQSKVLTGTRSALAATEEGKSDGDTPDRGWEHL